MLKNRLIQLIQKIPRRLTLPSLDKHYKIK